MSTYYIDYPVTTDQQALQDAAVAYLQSKVDGYVLDPAHPETWIIEAIGRMAAEDAYVLSRMPSANFRYLGESIFGLARNDGAPAVASTTWVARDTDGHDIPQGTLITIDGSVFQTDDLETIAPGTTSLAGVSVTAVEFGTASNSLGTNAAPVDSIAWLDSITVNGQASGGEDAETDEDYQDRLSQLLQLQSPRPIVANDFAIVTQQHAGVDRVLVLDNYDPYTNLLTANQASLETDTSGWNGSGGNTTIARSTAQASNGAASLSLTATAAGSIQARTITTLAPVNAGRVYTASAEFRAAATARSIRVDIQWLDSSSGVISTTTGTTGTDGTTGWNQASVTATAPANAAYGQVIVNVLSVASAEVHYVDKIALKLVPLGSTSNTTWSAGGVDPTQTERMVTVIPIDAAGQSILTTNPTLAQAIDDDLESKREINFVVNIEAAQYTPLTVVWDAKAYPNFDLAALKIEVNAAITDYLSPANWGTRPYSAARVWDNTPVVRANKLIQLIENVDGISYVNTVTINGLANVTMPGIAPLPVPLTPTGNVAY